MLTSILRALFKGGSTVVVDQWGRVRMSISDTLLAGTEDAEEIRLRKKVSLVPEADIEEQISEALLAEGAQIGSSLILLAPAPFLMAPIAAPVDVLDCTGWMIAVVVDTVINRDVGNDVDGVEASIWERSTDKERRVRALTVAFT